MEFVETQAVEFTTDANLVAEGPAGDTVARLVREMLVAFGEDPEREGLLRTPERVARSMGELLAGYGTDPTALINDAIFPTDYDGPVLVRDIQFFSLCEHHLLPFYGRAHVAYLPDRQVLGLSKIPRIVEMFARRLQIQEQMTQQIADFLQETLEPRGVAVMVEGAHMCAMMRGVRQSSARMDTRTVLGAYAADARLRDEIMAQLGATAGNF